MRVLSLFAGALVLSLTVGCAFTEFKTERPAVKDDRITFVENGSFGLKPLDVVTKIDDEGCMNADVTFELGGSPFFTWNFCGTPMQKLVYRFDWVDAQGNILRGQARKMELLPGNILTVGAIAPSEKYKSFKFEVAFSDEECSKPAAKKCDKANVKKCGKKCDKANVKKCGKKCDKANVKKCGKKCDKANVKKCGKKCDKANGKKVVRTSPEKAAVKKVPATSASAVKKDGKLAESMD